MQRYDGLRRISGMQQTMTLDYALASVLSTVRGGGEIEKPESQL